MKRANAFGKASHEYNGIAGKDPEKEYSKERKERYDKIERYKAHGDLEEFPTYEKWLDAGPFSGYWPARVKEQ